MQIGKISDNSLSALQPMKLDSARSENIQNSGRSGASSVLMPALKNLIIGAMPAVPPPQITQSLISTLEPLLDQAPTVRTGESIQEIHKLMANVPALSRFFTTLGDIPVKDQLSICKYLKVERFSAEELLIKEGTANNLRVFFLLQGKSTVYVDLPRTYSNEDRLDMIMVDTLWRLDCYLRCADWDTMKIGEIIRRLWIGYEVKEQPNNKKTAPAQDIVNTSTRSIDSILNTPMLFAQSSIIQSPMQENRQPLSKYYMQSNNTNNLNIDNGNQSRRDSNRSNIDHGLNLVVNVAITKNKVKDRIERRRAAEYIHRFNHEAFQSDQSSSVLTGYTHLDSVITWDEKTPNRIQFDLNRFVNINRLEAIQREQILMSEQLYSSRQQTHPSIGFNDMSAYLRLKIAFIRKYLNPGSDRLVGLVCKKYLGLPKRTVWPGELVGERALEGKNVRTGSVLSDCDCL